VGCTIGSREEVPWERKPVIRADDYDDDDNNVLLLLLLSSSSSSSSSSSVGLEHMHFKELTLFASNKRIKPHILL